MESNSESIVEKSIFKARKAVSIVLFVSGCILFVLIAERAIFQRAHTNAIQDLIQAQSAADRIMFYDERLTMSANMAAATGDLKWIRLYNDSTPKIEQAINDALKLASPRTAETFDQETKASNDKLVRLEMQAISDAQKGLTEKARSILNSPEYLANKEILSFGTEKLTKSVIRSIQDKLSTIKIRAVVLSIGIVLLSIVGAKLFWRSLRSSLEESKDAYLDAEKQINRLATRDVLTGLSNRYTVVKQFEALKIQYKKSGSAFSAMMLDLDKFKPINDQYGHLVGDAVLKEIASRISAAVGPSNYCARYGGDEFVCFIVHEDGLSPNKLAQQIVQQITRPIHTNGLKLEAGCSIGIAQYGGDCTEESELLRRADVALYEAKKIRNNTITTYDVALEAELNQQQTLVPELRAAISANQIEPYYQPIVDLETGKIRALEILARWQHPQRGMMMPGDFLGAARSADLVAELTRTVLGKACTHAKNFPKNISLCLNLSSQELQNEWVVEDILSTISRSGIPAYQLEVELGESSLIKDPDKTRQIMISLNNIGVRIALNDFGRGHSSISSLSNLPLNNLKIHRDLVSAMKIGNDGTKTVKSIIGLARNLDIDTVAVGIETRLQRKLLHSLGCRQGQGFLFSKPLPACDISKLLVEENSRFLDRADGNGDIKEETKCTDYPKIA